MSSDRVGFIVLVSHSGYWQFVGKPDARGESSYTRKTAWLFDSREDANAATDYMKSYCARRLVEIRRG